MMARQQAMQTKEKPPGQIRFPGGQASSGLWLASSLVLAVLPGTESDPCSPLDDGKLSCHAGIHPRNRLDLYVA